MSVLAYQQIKALVLGEFPVVAGYVDLEAQIQTNGMDLTLHSIGRFAEAGRLGRSNAQRRLPPTEEMAFDQGGELYLAPGPYLVTLNEVVHLPVGLTALSKPRSSLLRSGVALHTSVWDAGYQGQPQSLLVVYNPHGFTMARDARILQLVFFTLEAPSAAPYTGRFQGEHP